MASFLSGNMDFVAAEVKNVKTKWMVFIFSIIRNNIRKAQNQAELYFFIKY